MRRNLGGVVVAVTGGARGIGFATGRAFASQGARVALGDIDAALAVSRADMIGGMGASLDVRCEDSCAGFFERVRTSLGPIDIVVNSAGVAVTGDFLSTSLAEDELQLCVNLTGVIRIMRAALPAMLERGSGHVINIASAGGRVSAPYAAVYSASKQAVVSLSEAVYWELRGTGVHVTAILPTVVATEMAAGLSTRGLPTMTADRVAKAIVGVAQRTRPPVVRMVPRWLRAAALIDALAPQWLRGAARRVVTIQAHDDADRRAYRARIATQIEDVAASHPVGEPSKSPASNHDYQ
jgi:short-subunit dehydrogenase